MQIAPGTAPRGRLLRYQAALTFSQPLEDYFFCCVNRSFICLEMRKTDFKAQPGSFFRIEKHDLRLYYTSGCFSFFPLYLLNSFCFWIFVLLFQHHSFLGGLIL